jgi:predicted DNA-binding transcriptional regulator YafY
MAKSKFQKLKMLYVRDAFERNTDAEHGITVNDLIDRLDEVGIEAERKSIYDDIALLSDVYGMNIEKIKIPHSMEYRLTERDFELYELKLLCDAVQASRFITEKKSEELIAKLKRLCSRYEAEKLSRQVHVSEKIKNMNESIYYNVDAVFEAISAERSIRFKYFNRTLDSKTEKKYRREGGYYEVSPYALTYSEEKYYLIAYDFEEGAMRHFRVDRMDGIEQTQRPRDAQKYFSGIELGSYTDRHFGMYGGEEVKVGIRFDAYLANAVYDRFGTDIAVIREGEGKYLVFVSAVVSAQFFGWLAGLGPGAKIVSPEKVARDYEAHLRSILADYEQ